MEEKGIINNLGPKTAFKAGLVTGLVGVIVIGFFVLLGMMLGGKLPAKNTGNIAANNNAPAANPTNPTAPTAPTNTVINIKPVDKNNDWIRGDKNAKISIVEFSDIDCPFCVRFHPTMQQVMANYGGKVNWVWRHFPLTTLHPEAFKKAVAAECVGELGGEEKFWAFLDEDMSNKKPLAQINDTITKIGVDVNKFTECLNSTKYDQRVNDQSQDAQAAGARGTPYSVILSGNTKAPINGALPYETIKAQLDALLK